VLIVFVNTYKQQLHIVHKSSNNNSKTNEDIATKFEQD